MKVKKFIIVCLVIVLCLGFGVGLTLNGEFDSKIAYAEQEEIAPKVTTANIPTNTYQLDDNTGYKESEDKKVDSYTHPLKSNLMKLSLYTQSGVSQPVIDRGEIDGYNAYGITGSCAIIQLSYNFDNPSELYRKNYYDGDTLKTDIYSISSDTAQQVGDVERLGVVGTGAMIFQKKSAANGAWEWQTKDGETKKNLHTVNFTDTVPLSVYGSGEKYVLYTPSGADLSRGVFIKITFAYEIKVTTSWEYKNWLGIKKTKSQTKYINMLETAEFYLVQNSGAVLFRNASTFDKVGDDDGSGAISFDDFDTILDGDVTLNGFRLDTLGVDTYEIKYRYNGGEEKTAADGQFFYSQGRYDFTVKRKLGQAVKRTIFVDRREVNDAVVGYFGQSLFTPDSQRVYTTGEYPTYIAGKATYNLNATDGTVVPLVGKLFKIQDEEEKLIKVIAQSYGSDYKTEQLQGTIDEVGIYKAEFWSNPRYTGDGSVSGDLYHFTFRFEIVDKDTPKEPSINEAYLNGLLSFCDMQSKYYAVVMPTKGAGSAIFAFSDFGGAYDFAYEIERGKVENKQGKYIYGGKTYDTQRAVLAAVDERAKALISQRYFDSTDPQSYQTADVDGDRILDMNYPKDVIVFLNEDEQSYMQAGLPSLNGRKYRYESPETGEIQEGVMEFAFLKVADFESSSVTLTHKNTRQKYDVVYGVSVEYQLGLANAPSGVYTVTEKNVYGDISEYEAVYIKPGEMTGTAEISLFRGGEFIDRTFGKNNAYTESGLSGFVLKSLSNDLDIYSIVKISHNGNISIYSFDEVSDMRFSDGGVYDITLADRLGNTAEFSLIITNPVGYADVYLQLEQEDENIQKHFNVFVGQKIQLPIPTLASELYVFDGWLYEDKIVENNVFIPDREGTLYVWQQISQKYTYLNFDSVGGGEIEPIKAEIGKPVELPVAVKDGWSFGGWEYGGTVYSGEYIPTSASPAFSAVWNYLITQIELYDGNLSQTIDAHVGEKVTLPFPTRTGYTFFGWREKLSDFSSKVYYGQITSLENIDYLRLDALWIRQSEQDETSLSGGSGGRTMIHFVDGELLSGDSLQAAAGSAISLPKVTRAGFVFIGWIWKTTSTSGKIFSDNTMTVPSDTDGKLVLHALWIARGTTSAQSAAEAEKTSVAINSMPSSSQAALGGLACAVCLILALCIAYAANKKILTADRRSLNSDREDFQDKYVIRQRRIRNCGAVTLLTAIALVIVLTVFSAFGGWADMGIFKDCANNLNVTPVQTESFEEDVVSNTFELDGNADADAAADPKPSKEAVLGNIQDSGILDNSQIDLTDEELFIFSLITIELHNWGYTVFPARIILPNDSDIFGIAYSNHKENYKKENEDNTIYFSAGFIAFPKQTKITEKDIDAGLVIKSLQENNYDQTTDEKQAYMLMFLESFESRHFVNNGNYVTYSVEKTELVYTIVSEKEAVFNLEYGAVYSYDDNRYIFDPDFGATSNISATSLNTLLDPVIAQNEYNRYIAEQTANGFTVDTLNFVFVSYEALEAYQLNGQDESFLGIDLQEFYDFERTLGENEYYAVGVDGTLTRLEFPPDPSETKAQWTERLCGALLGAGLVFLGIVISAVATVATCGAGTAIAPYITGALMGAGIEILMQTLVQGKGINDINWARVGIATVSGVLSSIPGVGMITAGLIQGATEAAFTAVDGGSLEDVAKAFTVGFVTGLVINGLGKAVRKYSRCFVAGTAVLMASGTSKAIENVRVGDVVKSLNVATNKLGNNRVLQVYENETKELVNLSTSNGEQIVSTPGHKYYSNNSWVSAKDLRAGDILINVNGEKVIVEQVQHEILDNPVKVYNFEVANNHNYFVATNISSDKESFVLVHNKACGGNAVKGNGFDLDEFTKGYDNVVTGKSNAPVKDINLKNSIYLKKNGDQIKSIVYYDKYGNQMRRIDISGKPHYVKELGKEVIPHDHHFPINIASNGDIYRNQSSKDVRAIADEIVNKLLEFFSK